MKNVICFGVILFVSIALFPNSINKSKCKSQEYKADTIDLAYLKINDAIPMHDKKENVYRILGKPDSVVNYGMGPFDSIIIAYFGNVAFDCFGDSFSFNHIYVKKTSKFRVKLWNFELNYDRNLKQIQMRFVYNSIVPIRDSEYRKDILWCPVNNHFYADALQFIFENGYLVEVAIWDAD